MRFHTWSCLVIALMLQACVSTGVSTDEPIIVQPPAYTPQAGLTDKERFKEVLVLLEQGEPEHARAELVLYLQNQPKSSIGSDLLQQIDLPATEYFPTEYAEMELPSGVSLSSLAKRYLGSVFKFHALAKYNDIARPSDLTAGQIIRIPLTPEALKAIAEGPVAPLDIEETDQELLVGEPSPAQEDENTTQEEEPVITEAEVSPDTLAAQVTTLHRDALNAYRAQNLDMAIELWDEALQLDPSFESARLYRSQAIELKQKLSSFD